MEKILFLMFIIPAAMTAEDSITPLQTQVSRKEGESVTLRCSYDSTTEYVLLYWYRQYPDQAPQYILLRGARSNSGDTNTAEFAQARFSSNAERTSTTLTISNLAVGDTAVYLCALRPAQCEKDIEELYKNHLCQTSFVPMTLHGLVSVTSSELHTVEDVVSFLW